MLLWDSPVSGNCYKVRLLLDHLGIAYERRTMDVADRSDRPEVLGGLNPSLRPTRRSAPGSTESLCGRDTSRSTRDVLIAGGGGRVARLLLFRPSGW